MQSLATSAGRLVGIRGGAWLAATAAAAIALSAVECLVALFLQVFLVAIGLVPEGGAPPWIARVQGRLSIQQAIGAMVLLGLARSLGYYLVGQGGVLASEHVNLRLRLLTAREVFLRAEPLPPFVAVHRLSEVFPRAAAFALGGSQFLAFLIVLILVSAGSFALAPREAAIAILGLVPVVLASVLLARRIGRHADRVPGHSRALAGAVQRITRNWIFIRVTGTQDREYRSFERSARGYFASLARSSAWAQGIAALPPFAGVVLLAGVILASRIWFATPGITLVALLYLLVRLFHVLREMAHHGATMIRFRAHFREAIETLPDALPAAPAAEVRPAAAIAGLGPSIEFEDVAFTQPGQAAPVLSGVSFSVAPGGAVGIVGPSGCGKTTLLGLLLGVLVPERGRISIDGRPAPEFLAARRGSIGFVGASPFLVDGTIRENLLYGLPTAANGDALAEAVRFAGLDEALARLAGGLDHPIDADGHGLSAGQLQRLALARAVLRRPSLLVLDEPSANLDAATEALLARNLDSLAGRTTIVVVSHRPGLLTHLDDVLDLGAPARPAATAAAT